MRPGSSVRSCSNRSRRSAAAIPGSMPPSSRTRWSAVCPITSGPGRSPNERSASTWSASPSTAHMSDDAGIVARPVLLLQEPLVELAVVVAGQVLDEVHAARALVGGELSPAVLEQRGLQLG